MPGYPDPGILEPSLQRLVRCEIDEVVCTYFVAYEHLSTINFVAAFRTDGTGSSRSNSRSIVLFGRYVSTDDQNEALSIEISRIASKDLHVNRTVSWVTEVDLAMRRS